MSAENIRRYTDQDLYDFEFPLAYHNVTQLNFRRGKSKHDLVKIIRGQMDKWPEESFNHSKIKKDALKAAILANEFIIETASTSVQNTAAATSRHTTSEWDNGAPGPDNFAPPELRSIELLVEDMREEPPNRFIQTVLLAPAEDLETGQCLVDGHSLLYALQTSPSALDGPVKLAFEDVVDAGWKRYFAKVSEGTLLRDTETSPKLLTVPAGSRLKIIVEDAGASSVGQKRERSPIENEVALQAGTSPGAAKRGRTSQADASDVSWLSGLLSARPGWKTFQDNQRKKLPNKDRVEFWRFASQFSSSYFNKPSHANGRAGKPVRKASIEAALSMGATALSEAEKMTRIMEKFGEGGEQSAQEVIDKAGADSIEGRNFPDFLLEWEKSHST
ncbi:hypothetical protein C8J57DRAFT_1226384 [Mycena rebaudengoi]|nr:hypothetical protein C8J57DRAFT_1226384 [Mycena rebaudengoi]